MTTMKLAVVLAVLGSILALTSGQGQPWCQGGMMWNDCGSSCNTTCWQRELPVCIEVCVGRCECPEGMYWLDIVGQCVSGQMCDQYGLFDGVPPPAWALPQNTTTPSWTDNYPPTTTAKWDDNDGDYYNCQERCMYGDCYYGDCTYGCATGWYGDDCSWSCSENCLYGDCDQEYGYCLYGCINGTDGTFCEDHCERGCEHDYYCDTSMDYWSCPYNNSCYDCGCQGQECVYDGGHTSTASIPSVLAAPLLFLAATVHVLMTRGY